MSHLLAIVVLMAECSLIADEPKPIELSIEARAIETPILKYRLLPPEVELKSGNAVPILLRLPWEEMPWMNQVFPTLKDWESRPLDAPEWKKFGGVFPDSFYNELKRAAFRRDASWEYPIGETPNPYSIHLSDMQGLRGFVQRGLSARIRYHLSRGELDKAREGILVGLANCRHLARTPFLVNQLVALAIDQTMLDRTVEMISQPQCPNLYWALSALPDSLVEWDRAASFEGDLFASIFPAANDLNRHRDPKEWSKMARQFVEFLEETGAIPRLERPHDGPVWDVVVVQQARDELPKMLGLTGEDVAAMSDDEAGLRWYVQMRISVDQRVAAVIALAPKEAWAELKKLQSEINLLDKKTGAKRSNNNPIGMYLSYWKLKRRIQALRIIEAVRHHLAAHGGRLPASLDEIKDVPVPIDPLTNLPFEWKVDGNTATLKAPPLPVDVVSPESLVAGALEYRLQVR